MSLKTIIVLIVTGLYFWAGQYWYTCIFHKVCGDQPPDSMAIEEPAYQEQFGALTYKYNDPKAYTSPVNFQALKDSILRGKTDDNILEITGLYFKDETTPTGFENMGVARAESARALLSADVMGERVRILHKQVDEFENAKVNPFKSVDFKWVEIKVEKSEVVQLPDKAVMLFPVNSVGMIEDPVTNKYFDDLAANIQKTGEKIALTGHTDNTGSDESNMDLGLRRAKAIMNILTSKGVDKNIITVESKGETMPVATNDSEAGRHQNRRVELRLIKQ